MPPGEGDVDPVESLGHGEARAQLADDLALLLHRLDAEAATVARRAEDSS
jgi:hypothetical protein